MSVDWTPHRFSGGALALDVANTVVLRGDPVRSFDRFADPREIGRFAEAAVRNRADELNGRSIRVHDAGAIAEKVLTLREAIDRLFRRRAAEGRIESGELGGLLSACAGGLDGHGLDFADPLHPLAGGTSPLPFEGALALSALSLLGGDRIDRIRICENCRWLFLDASRNRSRIWCDMAVCGNRRKAQRHYLRRRSSREEQHA
jgi:predicted RNA-binding Zn ribbon-like protein